MDTEHDGDEVAIEALHQALVDLLAQKGLFSSAVLEAFRAVPRHHFLPEVELDVVYSDAAIPTKLQDGMAISSSSQPSMMAIMLEALDLRPGHRVLEIGAGTGYNAALMAYLVGDGGTVTTVDIDEDIVEGARRHLAASGFDRVRVVLGDGAFGFPDTAPYDRIILTVRADDIAPAWWEQLRLSGRLVLPLGLLGAQKCITFVKRETFLESLSVAGCAFMQLRGSLQSEETFIPLGPEPGLLLFMVQDHSVDPDQLYSALHGDRYEFDTGLTVTMGELWGSFFLWLDLHDSFGCALNARGEIADRDLVPYLLGYGGELKAVMTRGLCAQNGFALLMCSPGVRPEMGQTSMDEPIEIWIRVIGPDASIGDRLSRHLTEWDRAGRPSGDTLRLRAYPVGTASEPFEAERVIRNPASLLVLEWQ